MSEGRKKEKSTWKKWWKEGQLGSRLLIGFAILISLALFLHFREVRIEVLELNSIAKKYVVAQVDFNFPDTEATMLVQKESALDIGDVYRIDTKELDELRMQFGNYLIKNPQWRKVLTHTTFEEIYEGSHSVKNVLLNMRFADQRTLQMVHLMKISQHPFFLLSNGTNDKRISLSKEIWDTVKTQLHIDKKYHPSTINFIIDYFSASLWKLVDDQMTQRLLRKAIKDDVPWKYTKVHAGSRILDQGERVTSRHLAMLQAMKHSLGERRQLWHPLTLLGSLLFALTITLPGLFYFKLIHKGFFQSLKKLSLFATIIILTLILAKVTEYFLLRNEANLIETIRYPLFIPFVAILLCVLIGAEISLFSTCLLSVILGLSLAVDYSRFIVINLLAGIIAILFARSLRKRKEVFSICGKVWFLCIPLLFVYNFIQNILWSNVIITDLISTFAFLLLTAIFVVGVLPIFESLFHIMTDITLMEYMDPNNELLRRLSIEAPGTYQHCLVVGSLSESAAQAIGANGLFCRVSTLYHDIGKLFNPHYFTENQVGGFDIHKLLTAAESTQVIIAHVTEGESLACKHGLPQGFIDVIREHHGTTLVYYFYCKQVEQMGGDVDAVDEKLFRYPGPTPKSKESAIIMIADTVEAASRSLEEVTEEVITKLVDRVVADKVDEGQLDNCLLTFRELGIVKKKIIQTLVVTRHLRVKYPIKR